MEERVPSGSHRLVVNNRKGGAMNEVLLETELGMLMIKGKDLHVNKLNLEKGEVDIDGTIDSLTYSEVSDYSKKGESLIKRLFS